MKNKLKKLLLWLVGGALGLFCLLVCAIWTVLGVGYFNWTATVVQNLRLVEAAEEYVVGPGASARVELMDDGFGAHAYGRHKLVRSGDDSFVLVIDRGGGHLGVQGYVYSDEVRGRRTVHDLAFDGFEGRALRRLSLRWWTYWSPEDK